MSHFATYWAENLTILKPSILLHIRYTSYFRIPLNLGGICSRTARTGARTPPTACYRKQTILYTRLVTRIFFKFLRVWGTIFLNPNKCIGSRAVHVCIQYPAAVHRRPPAGLAKSKRHNGSGCQWARRRACDPLQQQQAGTVPRARKVMAFL